MKILRQNGWSTDEIGRAVERWVIVEGSPADKDGLETIFYFSGVWVFGPDPISTNLTSNATWAWTWLRGVVNISDLVLVGYDWKNRHCGTEGQEVKILEAKDLEEVEVALKEAFPHLELSNVEIISRCDLEDAAFCAPTFRRLHC